MGVLSSHTGTGADLHCPSDWYYYDQHCYQIFNEEMNWEDAEQCSTKWSDGSSVSYDNLLDLYITKCSMLKKETGFRKWFVVSCIGEIPFVCKFPATVLRSSCVKSAEARKPPTPPPPFAQQMLCVAGSGSAAPDGPEGPINSA
ncbi:hypothetical protein Chor_008160 [Crotalus horridus]